MNMNNLIGNFTSSTAKEMMGILVMGTTKSWNTESYFSFIAMEVKKNKTINISFQ